MWVCVGEQPRTQRHKQIWLWLSPFWQFAFRASDWSLCPNTERLYCHLLLGVRLIRPDSLRTVSSLLWLTLSQNLTCVYGDFFVEQEGWFFFFNTHICVDKASEGRDQLHRAGMRQHNIRLGSETIPLNLRKSEKIKQRREQVENCEGHSEGERRWNIREQK